RAMASRLLRVPPPQELLRPLAVPERLLLGPGPSNVPPRIRAAGGRQLLGHMHPEMLQVMDEIKAGIQYAFQTRNRLTLAISGSGHSAMEAALCNLLEPGDTVLVAINGIWGQRAANIGRRLGANVCELLKPLGKYFTLQDIEQVSAGLFAEGTSWPPVWSPSLCAPLQGLVQHKPLVLFITHGESSTGVLQPLEGLGQLCHRHSCLLLVDAVASLGGVPIFMDQQEIDVLYSGSQKVLNAPPGSGPISFSERARTPGSNTGPTGPSCAGGCSTWGWSSLWRRRWVQGKPTTTTEQGQYEDTALCSWNCAWAALDAREKSPPSVMLSPGSVLGSPGAVGLKKARLPTITTIRVPEGYNWKDITAFLMDKHGMEIAGGLGPTEGKVLRIGLMGCNSTRSNVERVLAALQDALKRCRRSRL
ncbi:SPYA protein, partial [Alaudala cheleensis]|nr:SPYA protein [Alaudala cheleensis]